MPDDVYFSEREMGESPRDVEIISREFWRGFTSVIKTCISKGSLAEEFPATCDEYLLPIDCNWHSLKLRVDAELPAFPLLDEDNAPKSLLIIDGVEFFGKHISKVATKEDHSYLKHHHFLSFDRAQGFSEYQGVINRLFRRCRHPYELKADGTVQRIGPRVLQELLKTDLMTGEAVFDRLINRAIEKFNNPDIEVRKEAVEKLWDAWERLKTLQNTDKREGTKNLLETAIPGPQFRERINNEGQALTDIGNDFHIRHSETSKIPIERAVDIDYLFHRLYALIHLLVKGGNIKETVS